MGLHGRALVNQEDEVPMSVAERLSKFLELQVNYAVSGENGSQLVHTLLPDARVILLSRIDTLDEAIFG